MVVYDMSYTTYLLQPDLHHYVDALWIAVGIFWLATSVWTKRSTRVQGVSSRAIHILLVATGFLLFFANWRDDGLFTRQFLPDSATLAYTGLALTAAGIAFAIWARLTLGRNWSGIVTTKQDHSLVRRGPYAVVRHPIYSGGLLALFGTALSIGELRGFIGLILVFIGWWTKSRLEEQFMLEQFGAEYASYQHEVKALIPFVL